MTNREHNRIVRINNGLIKMLRELDVITFDDAYELYEALCDEEQD